MSQQEQQQQSSSLSTTTTNSEEQQTAASVVPEDNGPPPKIQMKLHILQLIKQKQNENGLKHLDYDSYRRYCTKRLRKLRTLLDMKHKKESKFTQTPKKKKKNLKSTTINAPSTATSAVESTSSTTQPSSSTTTPATNAVVVDGIKNSSLYSQKKMSEKIVERYKEKREIQIKKLREQALRNLIRENVEKQIHEQKEKLLATFVKKKKKESKKTDKNLQYDPEFLSELYTRINTNPTITDEEIEEHVKKLLNSETNTTSDESNFIVKGDERFLHLLLVQAERAWSHSRHLRNEMKQYPDNSRIKFHQLNRLKKAVKWSKLLLDYCNVFSDDQHSILEAEAYHSYMLGLYYLEKEEWAEALKLFKQSQTVYDQLYKVLTSIPQQVREEYKKQVNEIAVNYMRLCEYNLKKIQGGDLLLQQLESNSQQLDLIQLKLSQVKDAEDKSLPSTQQKVEWEGVMSIIIPNEKIRVNLANGKALLDADYKTVESKLRAFDKLFGIYNDTMRMIREEMKILSSGGSATTSQKRGSGHSSSHFNSSFTSLNATEQLNQLRFLHSYVSYVLGSKTIERNVIMLQSLLDRLDTIQQQVQKERIEKKQKTNPVDVIRLFDGLLQNVNDLSDLLQSININPESAKKLQTDLDEKKNVFTSYRCYYMAHAYALQHKWAECYLLLERSEQLLNQLMLKNSSTFSLPNPKDILSEIRKAKITAKSQQILSTKKRQGTSILSAYDSDDEKEKKQQQQEVIKLISEKPLTSRMDQFIIPSKTVVENLQSYSLVELPPKYQLIPNKPVFFDIANSLVCEYPTDFIDEQVKELSKSVVVVVEKPPEEPKKKGWFGLW